MSQVPFQVLYMYCYSESLQHLFEIYIFVIIFTDEESEFPRGKILFLNFHG